MIERSGNFHRAAYSRSSLGHDLAKAETDCRGFRGLGPVLDRGRRARPTTGGTIEGSFRPRGRWPCGPERAERGPTPSGPATGYRDGREARPATAKGPRDLYRELIQWAPGLPRRQRRSRSRARSSRSRAQQLSNAHGGRARLGFVADRQGCRRGALPTDDRNGEGRKRVGQDRRCRCRRGPILRDSSRARGGEVKRLATCPHGTAS